MGERGAPTDLASWPASRLQQRGGGVRRRPCMPRRGTSAGGVYGMCQDAARGQQAHAPPPLGGSTSSTQSTSSAIAVSDCPTPTVSTSTCAHTRRHSRLPPLRQGSHGCGARPRRSPSHSRRPPESAPRRKWRAPRRRGCLAWEMAAHTRSGGGSALACASGNRRPASRKLDAPGPRMLGLARVCECAGRGGVMFAGSGVTLSPRMAPPLNWDEGSTASTATLSRSTSFIPMALGAAA